MASIEKSEKRQAARDRARKGMRVSGRSVFVVGRIIAERSREAAKRLQEIEGRNERAEGKRPAKGNGRKVA